MFACVRSEIQTVIWDKAISILSISYYNVSRKEIDLAENLIPMIFPENEYYDIFVGLDGIIKGLYRIIERF